MCAIPFLILAQSQLQYKNQTKLLKYHFYIELRDKK